MTVRDTYLGVNVTALGANAKVPLKKIKREKHTKQALFLCDVSPVSFLGALLKREREARQGRHGDFHVEPGEKASRSALGSVQICRARVVFCVMRSANIGNGGHNPGRKRRRVSIHPQCHESPK